MFSKFDMLGERLSFFHNDYEKIKTNFGGMFTILLFFLLGLLIFGFGRDFFKRANPITTKSTESLLHTPIYNITNKNFSYAARLEDSSGNALIIPTLFEIQFAYTFLKRDESGVFIPIISKSLEPSPCTPSDFFEGSFAERPDLDQLLCPNLNGILLGGFWDEAETGYLETRIIPCPTGKTNSKGEECGNRQEKMNYLEGNLFIAIYYQRSIIDPNDYYQGIKKIMETDYFPLDNKLFKSYSLKFYEVVLETDYGWMIEDIQTISYLGLSTKSTSIAYFENLVEGEFFLGIGGINIEFLKEKDRYKRSYEKIQSLVAQVGGILKIFMLGGYIIVSRYNLHHIQLKFSEFIQRNIKNEIEINNIKNNEFGNYQKFNKYNVGLNSEIEHNKFKEESKEISGQNIFFPSKNINDLMNSSKNYINSNIQNISISRFTKNINEAKQNELFELDNKNKGQINSINSKNLSKYSKIFKNNNTEIEELKGCKCEHVKIGIKSLQFLTKLENKLQPINIETNNIKKSSMDSIKSKEVGFIKAVDMSLNLAIYLTKMTCCLSKNKKNDFRAIEKRFNSKLNVEFIVPKILLMEKLFTYVFDENIVEYVENQNF